jgi:N-acetylneuraminic acid mutarotase
VPPALVSTVAPFALPSAVQREVAVPQGSRVLLAGGLGVAGTSASGVFSLDPSTGRVSALGTLPSPFHDAAGALIGGRLFVFGGGSAGGSTDLVQAFDPSTGRGSVVGHLPVVLSDVSSATVDGVVYLVGGYDGVTARAEIYATVDGVRFEHAGDLPEGLRYTAVVAAGSKLLIAGGETASAPVATVSLFDPKTSKVTALPPLPVPVGHAAAFVVGGTVYVAGGLDGSGHAVRAIARIDPSAGTVGRVAPLPKAVSDGPAAVSGGVAWIIGGWRGIALTQVLEASVQ